MQTPTIGNAVICCNQHNRSFFIADAQGQLKQETQNLSQQLSSQQAPTTSPSVPAPMMQQEHPSKQHLDDSVDAQGNAVQELSENDTQTGVYQQEKSLEDLNKALEALKSDQNQQCDNPQQQGEQQQSAQQGQEEKNQEDETKDTHSPDKAEQDDNDEDKKQSQAMQMTDDADSILDEEKENNKQRMPFSSGGFKEVDKDW